MGLYLFPRIGRGFCLSETSVVERVSSAGIDRDCMGESCAAVLPFYLFGPCFEIGIGIVVVCNEFVPVCIAFTRSKYLGCCILKHGG